MLWQRVSSVRRSTQTGQRGACAVVPPPSASVSASLRSACLFLLLRRRRRSSSDQFFFLLLPPPPPLRPAADCFANQNTNTQVPAREPLPPRGAGLAATSLHVENYAPSSLPIVTSSAAPSPPPSPFKAPSAPPAGAGVSRALCEQVGRVQPPPSPGVRDPALAAAIVLRRRWSRRSVSALARLLRSSSFGEAGESLD